MKRFIFTVLTLCLFAVGALAQSNTGNLVGTVSDPSGVIPGATITAKDNATGKERTVTASGDGSFTIPQLEVGTYTVTVTAADHKTFTATDVKIDVGKDYSLNPVLEVGNINENVTVVAGADVINTSSGELSTTVNQRQIQELPLNGRNPLALITLQAGSSSNGATSTVINGQRTSFTNITRDGLNVQDNFIRANATDFLPDRPNVDDTGEFTIVTQNAGAESGYGASQVQLVTPRGSNDYHGAVYLYNRNAKFAANTFFRNQAGNPRPFLNRNQFGGKLGGPIIKDRFFFFGAYEGFRLRQSANVNRTILLPQARTGVFTYRDNAGVVRTANVLTLAGVPADATVASRILANVPAAGNTTAVGDQLNTTGFNIDRTTNQDREAFTARFDFDFNANQSLNVVYAYKKELLQRNDVDAQQGGVAAGYTKTPFGLQDAHTPFLAIAHRWSPMTTLTNEIRGGFQFSDPRFDRTNRPAFFLQIPLITNPESGFETQGRNTKYWNAQDNAVWTSGNHSLRFGGSWQAFRIEPFGPGAFGAPTIPNVVLGTNVNTPSLVAGQFTGGISSAQLGAANSLLALLGGFVSSVNQQFNVTGTNSGFIPNTLPRRNLEYEHWSFYAADQWRARPNFTLNYGLRYELYTPVREPNRLALEPVIPQGSTVLEAILNPNGVYDFVGGNAGGDGKFFRTDKNNFGPVVSFAYSPEWGSGLLGKIFPEGGRSVIRGGFRISYANDEFVRSADNALIGNQGLSLGSTQSNLNFRLNGFTPNVPTPAFQVPRTYVQNNLLASRFGTVFAINPDVKVPSIMEYNFSIEREIGWDTAFELRYVGGRSNNLLRALDFNQVDIRDNGFLADFNRARANFVLTGNANCAPTPGCQPLTVFPNLGGGGLLTNATVIGQLLAGTPADLAIIYIQNNLAGTVRFLPNLSTGVADSLENDGRYRYNSLQAEIRRRFSDGLALQANYTFQKVLTNAPGVGQTRFDPVLDIRNQNLEYQRADFDQTHVFNFNTIYELPFGRGRKFLSNIDSWADRIVGGWQFTSIIRASTGAPITITDARGTLNRVGRSGRQTPTSNLSNDALQNLFGIFRTACGVYFINPSVININPATCAGRGSEGFGQAAFNGQVFFSNAPGTVGNVQRAISNGPFFFNWDASIIKNIPITERVKFQIRGEAFNVLNRANFFAGQFVGAHDISSTSFGRITSTFDPRIIQFVGRLEF